MTTFNPTTHLLRPLREGEVIQEGDITTSQFGTSPSNFVGDKYDPANSHFMHFRPVEIPRWRERGEEQIEIQDGETVALLIPEEGVTGLLSYFPSSAKWTHFFLVPSIHDIPKPSPLDQSRKEFEAWWSIEFKNDTIHGPNEMECAFAAWQAARKQQADKSNE